MLQLIGTEALRDNLHHNVWVNALFADYKKDVSLWVIDDVRFANEAETILKNNGILIRLTRDINNGLTTHSSETMLDDWTKWTHVIDNSNMSLDELEVEILKIINQYA